MLNIKIYVFRAKLKLFLAIITYKYIYLKIVNMIKIFNLYFGTWRQTLLQLVFQANFKTNCSFIFY